MLHTYRNNEWNNKLKRLRAEDLSLWKIARALTKQQHKILPIKVNNTTITETTEKLEAFADSVEDQFSLNPNGEQENEVRIRNFAIQLETMRTMPHDNPQAVTQEEIEDLIKISNSKREPGQDNITNLTLKNLTKDATKRLTDIVNTIIALCYFPSRWKKSQTILIKKPNKRKHSTQSYRPISLLPAISKVIERAIYTRQQHEIQNRDILPNYQFEFRRNYSTIQQVAS